MLFSVIVPFLNEEKYLKECIESLLAQDFDKEEYELIFVDDGSTDNSLGIVKEFPEIKLLHEASGNVFAARNTALKAAQGEIIAFTDADCRVAKDWLSQIYRGMEDAGAAIVLGKTLFPQEAAVSLHVLEEYLNSRTEYIIARGNRRYFYGYTNNMAVRAVIFKQLGGFKEWPVPGDTEIIHRYLFTCPEGRVIFLSQMQVFHLEVKKLNDWYKKNFYYCMHNILLEKYTDFSPVSLKIKMEILALCSKKYRHSLLHLMRYCFVFAAAGLFYLLGRCAGKLRYFFYPESKYSGKNFPVEVY